MTYFRLEGLKRYVWAFVGTTALGLGCASVEVKAPKEPIKMDINMRLDVYQHVVKDIDEIESIVAGRSPSDAMLVKTAHAADLDPAVEQAALRRRDRRAQIESMLAQGTVGENNQGLLSPLSGGGSSEMSAENSDREIIYSALAQKNGVSTGEIRKVYSERLRNDAPAGAQVQQPDGSWTAKN